MPFKQLAFSACLKKPCDVFQSNLCEITSCHVTNGMKFMVLNPKCLKYILDVVYFGAK